ncbi:unnamed protein product [Candida verbasci]|uniref:Uncharacterized protein n=1 Tax=Candida verbasci TaxID=1227364 RepID=A0A9W4TVN3_9ASCO|nr:unnamed protein product [Candida verbasci]
MSENSLQSIEQLKNSIRSFLDEKESNIYHKNYVDNITDESEFENGQVEDVIDKIESSFKIDKEALQDVTETEEAEITKFNQVLDTVGKEFIIKAAFHNIFDEILNSILANEQGSETTENKEESEMTRYYNQLALLLDYILVVILKNNDKSKTMKHVFYSSIQQVMEQLLNFSINYANHFWTFMETREKLYISKIYQNDKTERVQFLYCFQPLVNKYYIKTKTKTKTSRISSFINETFNTQKQDTYADTFRYRVKAFMSNCLSFEDQTGLNKYFDVAARDPLNLKIYKDVFSQDLIDVQKLINNPMYYLRKQNQGQLTSLTNKLIKVFYQLLAEEKAYTEKHKLPDFFIQKPPKSKEEIEMKKEKYSKKIYNPETYYLSTFNLDKSEFEEQQKIDQRHLTILTEIPKNRVSILFSIFMVSFFFMDLTEKYKNQLLDSVGAPKNTKHFTDDSTPNNVYLDYHDIKFKFFSEIKRINSQLAFLANHVQVSERIWWGFLLYGKDPKTGKSLFEDKILTTEELEEVAKKHEEIAKYKTSKLFNNYVTSEVTRKMRPKKDEGVKFKEFDVYMNSEELENVKYEIEELENSDVKDDDKLQELKEKRSALTWRLLRSQRTSKLFELSEMLKNAIPINEKVEDDEDEEMLEEDEIEEVKTEQNGDEKVKEQASGNETEPEEANGEDKAEIKQEEEVNSRKRSLDEENDDSRSPKLAKTKTE